MTLNLINPQYRFSLYSNLFSVKKPDGEFDMNQLIETVRFGYLRVEIESLRNSIGEDYKNNKMHLPAVTLSGTFTARNAESIANHSGLIQVDIDAVPDCPQLFQAICSDAYTYACFRSPGGKGIKVVVKINPSVKTHLEQFYALEKYYNDVFKVTIDPSCKDIARCMLLSYDADLYCNPFSKVYRELIKSARKEKEDADTHKSAHKKALSTSNAIKNVNAIIIAVQATTLISQLHTMTGLRLDMHCVQPLEKLVENTIISFHQTTLVTIPKKQISSIVHC